MAAFKRGDRVEVEHNGRDYPATIASVGPSGFGVKYQDGTAEDDVEIERIRKVTTTPKAKAKAKAKAKKPVATKSSAAKKPAAKKAKAARSASGPDKEVLGVYLRFLNNRQRTRVGMHSETVLTVEQGLQVDGKGVEPAPLDHTFAVTKSGNAYRHLDTGTQQFGAVVRGLLGIATGEAGTAQQFQLALMICLYGMMGYNKEIMAAEFFTPLRKKPVPLSEALPATWDEQKKLRDWVRGQRKKGRMLWKSAGFQTQGYRTIKYMEAWPSLLPKIAEDLRTTTTTWQEVNELVQTVPGAGPYTAAQSLLELLHGVYESNTALCFGQSFDQESMNLWCGFGPGPADSITEIFGPHKDTLEGLQELQKSLPADFKSLGIDFPYLVKADGRPRHLGLTDLEHSLCYFSRYLNITDKNTAAERESLYDAALPLLENGTFLRWSMKERADLTVPGALQQIVAGERTR